MSSFTMPVPPHWSTKGPLRRVQLEPRQEYLAFAKQLMALVRDGSGETEEAFQIRQRMDAPWCRMSADEQMNAINSINGLEDTGEYCVHLRAA